MSLQISIVGSHKKPDGYEGFSAEIIRLDIVTGEITGSGYFEDTTMEEKQTALPFEFSVPLTEYHLNRIEVGLGIYGNQVRVLS